MIGLRPNLKDRLVGPSLTGGNCHFDILPDNICPSHRVVLHLLHLHFIYPIHLVIISYFRIPPSTGP